MSIWNNIKRHFLTCSHGFSEKLKKGFLPRYSPSKNDLPSCSTPSKTSIQKAMAALLVKQFTSAEAKKEKTYHWGPIGWQVEQATHECKDLIAWGEDESVVEYFDRVLPAMANLAQKYRNNDMDESGYALGTVREIENALIALAHDAK